MAVGTMTIVPVTTSLDEFKVLLACDLSLMQADGAGRMELERHAQQRVRATYGLPAEDVAALFDTATNTMQINYRVPTRPEMIRINFTIKETPMFTVNEDEWADVPAGTTRAVPSEQRDTVRQQVWTGTQWRWIGSPFITYDAQINDVTAPVPSTDST